MEEEESKDSLLFKAFLLALVLEHRQWCKKGSRVIKHKKRERKMESRYRTFDGERWSPQIHMSGLQLKQLRRTGVGTGMLDAATD
jgi:hypothetical protein